MRNLFKIACKCIAVLAFGYGYAQTPQEKAKVEYEKKVTEQLVRYELKDLKTTLLLNKGIFTEDEVEFYRHLPRNARKQIEVPTSAAQRAVHFLGSRRR